MKFRVVVQTRTTVFETIIEGKLQNCSTPMRLSEDVIPHKI